MVTMTRAPDMNQRPTAIGGAVFCARLSTTRPHQQPRSLLHCWPCTGDWGKKPKPAAQPGPWQCASAGQRAVRYSTHVAPTPPSPRPRGTSVSHIMKRSDSGAACSALGEAEDNMSRMQASAQGRVGCDCSARPSSTRAQTSGVAPAKGRKNKHGLNQQPAGSPETAREDEN